MNNKLSLLFVVFYIAMLSTSCGPGQLFGPTITPSSTNTPTNTNTPTITNTPTKTNTPTITSTFTYTPTDTPVALYEVTETVIVDDYKIIITPNLVHNYKDGYSGQVTNCNRTGGACLLISGRLVAKPVTYNEFEYWRIGSVVSSESGNNYSVNGYGFNIYGTNFDSISSFYWVFWVNPDEINFVLHFPNGVDVRINDLKVEESKTIY